MLMNFGNDIINRGIIERRGIFYDFKEHYNQYSYRYGSASCGFTCTGCKPVRKQNYVEVEDKKVNAKSIMGMMTLSIAPGEEVTIITKGVDEEEAMNKIEEYLTTSK